MDGRTHVVPYEDPLNISTARLNSHLFDGAVFGISRISNTQAIGILRTGFLQAGPKRRSGDRTGSYRWPIGHGRHGCGNGLDASVDAGVRPTARVGYGDACGRDAEKYD